MRSHPVLIRLSLFLVVLLAACGVKGPPLPPVVAEPKESEEKSFLPVVTPIPSPSPSPSPAPKKAKKKKTGTQ